MQVTQVDVNNLNQIYDTVFEYPVPRKDVEESLRGTPFRKDDPPYTEEEQERVKRDAQTVWESVVGSYCATNSKTAIFTAGGPGAGKTTLLNQLRDPEIPYIDFDDVALKGMKSTYVAEKDPTAKAYTKWRPGSHYVTHTVTANLWRLGYSFYFGTTSTSPYTKNTYQKLKDLGYTLKIIHLSAPDQVRIESIEKREETWVQSTPEGTIEKGRLLPQRINDTFLKFADEIDFYWRGGVDENAQLAATWTRMDGIKVINLELYEQIKDVHDAQVRILGQEDLLWESSVERN